MTVSPLPPSATTTSPTPPSVQEIYERQLVGPLFRPWAEALLDEVPLDEGARILDVACGTGIVARLARARTRGRAHVTGVDLSPGMLAVARTIEPAVDWREGNAAALPVRHDERFDVVLCQQGLQFFPDRGAAAREMRRVLAPGGRAAISVWRALAENGAFADLNAVAERFVGPIADVRHAFTDPVALARLLLDAGFEDVRVQPMTLEVRFEVEPVVLARLNASAVVGMTAAGKGKSDAERAEVVAAIVEASLPAIASWVRDGAIVFPTSANVATARA